MLRFERVFLRSMMVGLLGLVLLGATWGPTKLAQLVLGAGLPQAGEVVPRQIPYRGYVEQNGTPLTSPAVAMRFRLYGLDGGVLHEEVQNSVVVQQGNFSVELGDATPIGVSVLSQNFLELEVAIGNPPVPLSGRQRLLSVAYAGQAASAWAAVDSSLYRGVDITTSLVPQGVVSAFAGTTAPPGWILCDGQSLSRSAYPALFAAIGTAYGAPDAVSFRLPDYRGRFLRGVDGQGGVDPDRDDRRAPWDNSIVVGAIVGSVQDDTFKNHSHSMTHDTKDWPVGFSSTLITASGPYIQRVFQTGGTGGNETRPKNAYVNWIIKY